MDVKKFKEWKTTGDNSMWKKSLNTLEDLPEGHFLRNQNKPKRIEVPNDY